MRPYRRAVLGLLSAMLLAPAWPAAAQEGRGSFPLRVHGEIRFRGELQDNYQDFNDDGGFFDPITPVKVGDDTNEAFPYRVRLALEANLTENLLGEIQFQVADLAGAADEQRDVVFANGDNADLYTAFIHWNRIGGTDWNLRIGRQELRVGNELLFGDLDYYNGISFDGYRIYWDGEPVKFQFWWTHTNETFASDADTNILGLSIDGQVERGDDWSFYGNLVIDDGLSGIDRMSLLVVGVRWTRMGGDGSHYLWNLEVAYQDGRIGNPAEVITDFQRPDFGLPTGVTGDDVFIAAWGIEGLFGYQWSLDRTEHRVYAHGYVATGDQTRGDRQDEGFRPLFQDFHRRLGRADIVQGTNVNAFGISYEGEYGDKHAAGIDVLTFLINEPANADTCLALGPGRFALDPGSLSRSCVLSPDADSFQGWFLPALAGLSDPAIDQDEDDLGREVDLWYDYFLNEYLSFNVELSVFFPGDAITQLQDVQDFQTLAPDPSALASTHEPTLLAGHARFLLDDDPATRLSAQIRLRF